MFLSLSMAVCAFVIVVIAIPLVRHMALKYGLTDQPGGRKKHDVPTPLIGGLVIFPVFMICSAFVIDDWSLFAPLFCAVALLVAVGAWDDHKHVSAKIKFVAQIIAACLVVFWGNTYVIHFGDLFGFGTAWLGPFKQAFSILALVLLINGVNLMDGLDGLAGGIGLIVLSFLAVIAVLAGQVQMAGPLVICVAVLLGFLVYNMRYPGRKKASIFMGDAGSLALGLILGWFCIQMARGDAPMIEPIAVAWLLTLPIIDTTAQFIRRMLQGRHPFDPDYHHFHYHFMTAGVPHARTVFYVLFITFLGCAFGVFALKHGIPPYVLTYTWIALFLGHIYMSLRPRRFRRVIKRLFVRDQS